ncbi:MAG TPA: hypothetical protein VFZ68_12435, partial [Acidimicrobiales bacterium]
RARGLADVVATLRRRWPALVVLAPAPPPGEPDTGVPPEVTHPPAGTVLEIGGLQITVEANAGGRLETRIVPLDPPAGPAPGPAAGSTRLRSRADARPDRPRCRPAATR